MYMPTRCPRCQTKNPISIFAAAEGLPCQCKSCGTVYDPVTDCEIQTADKPKSPILAGQDATYSKAS